MAAKCLRRADGSDAYFVALVQDITERRRAEEAVQKAQAELARVMRITAMGELAASIAHELNQPLGAIVNNSNTCLRLSAHGRRSKHEWSEALVDIVRDAARASEIVRRIRALGQQSTGGWAPLHLASVLADVLALVRPELTKRHLVVEANVPRNLPLVMGDRVQLQQVFLNLIMNAIEAVSAAPESRPRRIAITGSGHRLGERAAVLIAVSDSGPGFKADIAARLFEPFFTTKPQGTGMGLRISRSLVEAHGGQIWVMPDQNEGATFCFALPVRDKGAP
jgi:C4-dicarboxylate-specific signal transduction histidine kinase